MWNQCQSLEDLVANLPVADIMPRLIYLFFLSLLTQDRKNIWEK